MALRALWEGSGSGQLRTGVATGLLIAILGLAGFSYLVVRRRRWKNSIAISLIVLALLGALGGSGAYLMGGRKPAASALKPPPAEAPELGAREELNPSELARLQKAPLEIPRPQANATAPWPQWRGPNRDGASPESGLFTDWDHSPPKVLWKHPIGQGYSSFAVARGRVYTLDAKENLERVLCLNADTGEEVWSYTYPSRAPYPPHVNHVGPKATPTWCDGRLYTLGWGGEFHCLKEAAGGGKPEVVWKHDLVKEFAGHKAHSGYGFASSPLVEGDLVCVQAGGKKGSIVAFNRRDGKLVWASLTEMSGYSSPVAATLAGVRQIICLTHRCLYGLRAADGAKLWEHPWGRLYNVPTPIVVRDYVFISSSDEGCALLRVRKDDRGALEAVPVYVMRNKLMRNYYSSCVFHDGFLYGFDVGPGNLKCIDLRTGSEKWAGQRRPKGTLIYADGRLIVLTEGGALMAVKATPERLEVEGTVKGIAEGGELWALPVLANGRLYLRDAHEVICLDVTRPPVH